MRVFTLRYTGDLFAFWPINHRFDSIGWQAKTKGRLFKTKFNLERGQGNLWITRFLSSFKKTIFINLAC